MNCFLLLFYYPFPVSGILSKLGHVDSLRSLLALDHIKFDFLAFFKRFKPFAVDSCIVYENIISVLWAN